MRATTIAAAGLALLAIPAPADADDITDALTAAIAAYEQGEVQDALDEIAYATQLLNEMKTQGLEQFLPEPLDGWTREIDADMPAGLGMMGGGVGAAAEYSRGSDSFTISLMADNPMVAAMAGMLGNTALMTAGGGKMVRVGREKFVDQDGEITGLIGNRVLVQASGDDPDAMLAHLEEMDFRALAGFGN